MLGKDGEKLNFLMVYFKVYCKVDAKKKYNILIFFFQLKVKPESDVLIKSV